MSRKKSKESLADEPQNVLESPPDPGPLSVEAAESTPSPKEPTPAPKKPTSLPKEPETKTGKRKVVAKKLEREVKPSLLKYLVARPLGTHGRDAQLALMYPSVSEAYGDLNTLCSQGLARRDGRLYFATTKGAKQA